MSSSSSEASDPKSSQTVPGVKMLKQIWNIKSGKPPREKPPAEVVTDIYRVPTRKNGFPRRIHGNAVE